MSLRLRLPVTFGAVALATLGSLALASTAQATPSSTAAWSAATISPGESVTYTTTTSVPVEECYYVDGESLFESGYVADATYSSGLITYEELTGTFPDSSTYTIALFPVTDPLTECPGTVTEALADPDYITSATLGITPVPAPAPAPEPELAVTGADTATPLALGTVLLMAGAAVLIVRRKRAHA